VFAYAETANALVIGRLIQAIGAGCALTLVRAIARDAYRAEQLVKAIAYLTMFGTLGPMISPIIGGALTDTLGWRSVFGFAARGRRRDRAHRLSRDVRDPSGRENAPRRAT
jgi:DHA1 family bicyclomycin/chloramphenicol resistance-like MFS transporter